MAEVLAEFLEFPLTFAFYPAPDLDGVVCAHCLELDVVGQGSTTAEARDGLQEAIELYVQCKSEMGQEHSLYSPAPAEVWNKPNMERWVHRILVRVQVRANRPHRAEVTFAPNATRLGASACV